MVDTLSASASLQYDKPTVTRVSASPIDAASSSVLQIYGSNLGLSDAKYTTSSQVRVGSYLCAMLKATSTQLSCMLPVAPVGRDKIVVSLFGLNSTDSVFVDRMCSEGSFALPGDLCQACPAVRICDF